jgi:hypothetical protein
LATERKVSRAVLVRTSRELLAVDLRTYGEDDAARRVDDLSDAELERIFHRAGDYLLDDQYATASGASPLIAWTLAMAAVEITEGEARPLRWKRRKLKGIWPRD